MHILRKTLWIVIFMLLNTETAMIVKHISYNKENENKEKNISNITLRNDINIIQKVKLDLNKIFVREMILPPLFIFFMFSVIITLILIVIWFRCPHLLDNRHVLDISDYLDVYRRSQSNQPHVQQLNHYQVVYTRSNKSIEDDKNTEEND